jgi:glycosyltransferase involved in cell wall biosynthesis
MPGLSTEDRRSIRTALGTPDNTTVIIQASRFESWKGHLLNVTALKELGGNRRWEAWFVGGLQRESERKYVERVRHMVRALGLENRIRFLGQRADVPRLLAAADIHCQPNTGPEPFGIAFVEALAAQLPIVTTDLGASSEILDSSCSILVPPNNTASLARALALLIDSPAERRRLGSAGPQRAIFLSNPRTQTAKLAAVLDSLPRVA